MKQLDAVVVGAGFAGLYLIHRLTRDGFTVQGYETGDDVGGTWYWNRYPGARCDVESMDYSYSFDPEMEQEWEWTERFATQPEIFRYLRHVADRFDLKRHIAFNSTVESAIWNEETRRWSISAEGQAPVSAQFLVMATGSLSAGKAPEIKGLDRFAGETYFTGNWPRQEPDFVGKRVGVIGTGSSAIQAIPILAERADHLTVFQRTASFTIPAYNRPLTQEEKEERKANYRAYRERMRKNPGPGVEFESTGKAVFEVDERERREAFERAWQIGGPGFNAIFTDTLIDPEANEAAAEFIRGKITEIVEDEEIARTLQPTGYPVGSKRLAVDTGYYATFNRPNVDLVDLRRTPIVQVTEEGVKTSAGLTKIDVLVLATGFDAMTGSFLRVDITGRDGRTLKEKWKAGPRTYLGLMSAGFPNCFFIAGPGSPSVLSNMVLSIEQHVEWVSDCVTTMRNEGKVVIEAEEGSENDWVETVNENAAGTLFIKGNSWYLGANVPGKPRVFMPYIGGVGPYRQIAEKVAAQGYRGFRME